MKNKYNLRGKINSLIIIIGQIALLYFITKQSGIQKVAGIIALICLIISSGILFYLSTQNK